MTFKVGDLVTRKSYNHDILFRINLIEEDEAILYGVHFRLKADAPLSDLKHVDDDELKRRKALRKEEEENSFRKFTEQFQSTINKRKQTTLEDDPSSIELFH